MFFFIRIAAGLSLINYRHMICLKYFFFNSVETVTHEIVPKQIVVVDFGFYNDHLISDMAIYPDKKYELSKSLYGTRNNLYYWMESQINYLR